MQPKFLSKLRQLLNHLWEVSEKPSRKISKRNTEINIISGSQAPWDRKWENSSLRPATEDRTTWYLKIYMIKMKQSFLNW
jgi:hypothetical protein